MVLPKLLNKQIFRMAHEIKDTKKDTKNTCFFPQPCPDLFLPGYWHNFISGLGFS
jgi:hypothetical protein